MEFCFLNGSSLELHPAAHGAQQVYSSINSMVQRWRGCVADGLRPSATLGRDGFICFYRYYLLTRAES